MGLFRALLCLGFGMCVSACTSGLGSAERGSSGDAAAASVSPTPASAALTPAPAAPMPARAADGLVDSLGVVVHFSYPDTGYRYLTAQSPAPNGSNVLRTLQVLGVRHIRSGVADTEAGGLGGTTPSFGPGGRCAAYRSASANGEDFDLVTLTDDTRTPINTSESDMRVAVRCFGPYAGHILAIEGPNERGSGDGCTGVEPSPAPSMTPYVGSFGEAPTSECIPEILGQQRIMWLAREHHALPATTQLWSDAFANTACEEEYDIAHYTDSYGKHLRDYVDAVSAHAYLAFNEPEFTGGPGPYRGVPCSATAHLDGGKSSAAYDYINDTQYGTLRYYYEAARYSGLRLDAPRGSREPAHEKVPARAPVPLKSPTVATYSQPADDAAASRAKPVVLTETGYEAQCCGNTDTDVDVPTVAKYTLRELLASQSAGFRKTFIYELISDSESLGLTDRELNPKPVYFALANFIRLLADRGYASMVTRPLAIGIAAPPDVRYILYEKHDGSYWLVLWQIDPGYDHATMTQLHVAPATATLTLSRAPATLRSYVLDPNSGLVTLRQRAPSTRFVTPVTDMPAVVQIGGAAVSGFLR